MKPTTKGAPSLNKKLAKLPTKGPTTTPKHLPSIAPIKHSSRGTPTQGKR